jgi:hypothetical protein
MIALLGIGADSTNSAPTPPVYGDGSFEYIPIPEKRGPEGTTETSTYGTTPLRHGEGSMADYLDTVRPRPGDEDPAEYTGLELAEWPLHHDPNFEALTYGETTSRPAYTALLTELEAGDVVAFYTGLRDAESRYRHRYLVGYFTVNEVLDCRQIEHDGERVSFTDLPALQRERLMERHSENAHAKRFQATGRINEGDGLVVVDGTEPGGVLDRAVRISEVNSGGHHYLTDEFQEVFDPAPGGNPDRNAYLGGVKPAHALRISVAEFREVVAQWQPGPSPEP